MEEAAIMRGVSPMKNFGFIGSIIVTDFSCDVPA
jgi:hypothetical protein